MVIIYIVSACLAGVKCRYDGRCNRDEFVCALVEEGRAVPVCPEVLGGLPIPRVSCEIVLDGCNRQVINRDGQDVTEEFIIGAKKTLEIAKILGVEAAILKANSPSCGCGTVYDGTFTGKLRYGNGMTSQMLLDGGIQVYTEKDIERL